MTREYSGERTIHRNGELDVELDKDGHVVAVWYNCQVLPFRESVADDRRADEMRRMYSDDEIPDLLSVELDR